MKKIIHWMLGSRQSTGEYSGRLIFSQQGEDIHLQRYFSGRGTGFYVDIGAFHPALYSNTKLLYDGGWRGINVEPNPDHFAYFLKERPLDININAAIGNSGEELTYYCFNKPALNSFTKSHVDEWCGRPGYFVQRELQIETVGLSQLLATYLPAGTKIDLLSVDVEGWDLVVLQSNDWSLFRPELVMAEVDLNYALPPNDWELSRFMRDMGYGIWCISGNTVFFVDQSASLQKW